MSQIRIAKAVDLGAFPGSSFVIDGSPPIAQCQETQISEFAGSITLGSKDITDIGAFAGIDLAGKRVTVILPVGQSGTYNVRSNTDDILTTNKTFGATDAAVVYTVQDAGQTYLTRNESSFQRFTENAGKAHTTKGGQLFTDLADPPMDDACSDTFNPQ